MGTLLDLASLVTIPSGYKEDKLYSVKPTDGSGDLDFTRSNDTATRVNSAGLIEKVRTNLYPYSQSFADASWVTIDTTKVSTSATDPNGGATAANVTWIAGSGRYFYQNIGISAVATISFWVKSNGGGNKFRFFANGATSFSPDLTATSTWTRYSFAFSGNGNVGIGIANASDSSAADILIAFAQAELGDIATDYIPTTTAAVSVGMTANVPRLDYTGGGCGKLLLEPQRTNLVTFSEQFDNAAWLKEDILSVTANAIVSPDGYTNADLLIPNTNNIDHTIYQSSATGSAQTFSVFAKSGGYNFVFVGSNNALASNGVFFDLTDGTISQNTSSLTAKIEDYGNGWYRCEVTSTSWDFPYAIICTSSNGTSFIHAGDGTSGVYIWGAQLEAGSYATSYIPTLGAAVTRGADDCFKTGISSLIGQTEGVLYAEVDLNVKPESGSPVSGILTTNNNVSDLQNCIILGVERNAAGTNRIYCLVQVSNVTQAALFGTNITDGNYKIALAYKANDFALYVNGVQVATDTSGSVPTTSQVLIGTRRNSDNFTLADAVSQALLFPTRLTNTQLAELTTL